MRGLLFAALLLAVPAVHAEDLEKALCPAATGQTEIIGTPPQVQPKMYPGGHD